MNTFQHVPRGEPAPGVSLTGGGGIDKPRLLLEYATRYGCRSLVETGLYQGRGSGMALADRLRYIAVDWQWENVEVARGMGHEAYVGDSAAILSQLLDSTPTGIAQPEPPALFWLDAHSLTAEEGSPQVCPVLGELAAVAAWSGAPESVVLIDDVWGFGSLPGWPSLAEIVEACELGPWRVSHDETVVYCEPL